MGFDTIDATLLRTLMRRGRSSWAELSELLRLSPPAAADRVHKLEERGVIRGYAALVDPVAAGCPLTAFIAVNLASHQHRAKFLKSIAAMPEILECHHVAGEHDFLLKVRCTGT